MSNLARFIFSVSILTFWVATSYAFPKSENEEASAEFPSTNYCQTCHPAVYSICKNSIKGKHHFYANTNISKNDSTFVNNTEFTSHDTSYKFYKDGDSMKVASNEKGKESVYQADMVIGVEPLKQYLLGFPKGRYQTLSSAVDVRNNEVFETFGDDNRLTGEWGHWSGQGMNWNANCAYCHMTDYKKNYDLKTDSYHSQWLEQGIRCVQCHSDFPADCYPKDKPRVNTKPYERMTNDLRMQMCASCHSRREQLTNDSFKPADSYFDHFRPILPDVPNIYYPDGQVLSEDFVYGSFMMCRQYIQGITCLDCHDPHTLQLAAPIENNKLCMTCHDKGARNRNNAPTIDVKAHTFHDSRGGDQCISCHMPKTTYMGRDSRYDHGLTSPDPYLTKTLGIPNACSTCHDEIDKDKQGDKKGLDWLIEEYNKRHSTERLLRKRERATAVNDSYLANYSAAHKNKLVQLCNSEEIPAWKSVLISLMVPYIGNADVDSIIKKSLDDEHPLVRSSAVRAMAGDGVDEQTMQKILNDSSRLVRLDAAMSNITALSKESNNFKELQEYLDFNADTPMGSLRRANFNLAIDNILDAIEDIRRAVALDKTGTDVIIESAVLANRAGDNKLAEELFTKASSIDPNNVRAWYMSALFYAELNDIDKTISSLEKAIAVDKTFLRGYYNLSIAYMQKGDRKKAIEYANKLLELEPGNMQNLQLRNYMISLPQQ